MQWYTPRMKQTLRASIVAIAVAWLGGCGSPGGATDAPDAPDASDAPPDAPIDREQLFDPYGAASKFDVATWNIEAFPKSDTAVTSARDVIFSLGVDMIAVEEIASVNNFDLLMAGLPEYDAVLSEHRYAPNSYQKVGLIVRKDVLTVRDHELLFTNQSGIMPRPPLRVGLTYSGPDGVFDFDAVVVHLKAGQTSEDRQHREASIAAIDAYIRDRLDAGTIDRVVLLGDFNTDPTENSAQEILAPILTHPEIYQFPSRVPAQNGDYSFLPSNVMLDHVVLAGDFSAGASAEVVKISNLFTDFENQVSDHVPVFVGY